MLPYDDSNPESIERYAKKLIGKTFKMVIEDSYHLDFVINNPNRNWGNPNQKGQLGNLIEEQYFGYPANSDQDADFPKAGVELKLTCFDRLKNGKISAGERLVLTMISYEEPVEHDFYKSHVWEKCHRILLIYYERMRQLAYNTLYPIRFANIITPPANDMPIIKADYNKIISIIESGRAEELSESLTMYLGACTKGSTAARSMRPQFYPPHTLAMKRAFCFKRQYMDYLLHTYIETDTTSYEPIIKNTAEIECKSFEEIVYHRLQDYIGLTDKYLCTYFGREYNKNKAQWVDLTYRMLGIKGNHIAEFEKANIKVKTIRIQKNGKSKEQMSFPAFKFMDLISQEWETSSVCEYFEENQFFFVIWKENDEGTYTFIKAMFWRMPYNDLNGACKEGWIAIRDRIKNGVTFNKVYGKNGKLKYIENNIPGIADNPIIHLRPHAQKSAYYLHDGTHFGNIERDANLLPDGQFMTTQSFWLNANYFVSQLNLD